MSGENIYSKLHKRFKEKERFKEKGRMDRSNAGKFDCIYCTKPIMENESYSEDLKQRKLEVIQKAEPTPPQISPKYARQRRLRAKLESLEETPITLNPPKIEKPKYIHNICIENFLKKESNQLKQE